MSPYHTSAPMSRHQVPVREIRWDNMGRLLLAGPPRYDTLAEYVEQFAAPLSMITGSGLYSFRDPLFPELRLLVECEDTADWCETENVPLADCTCAF
jgi:hypothetical protein